MSQERTLLHVVAGVLYDHSGAFLLSSRPAGKPYAGYWEFAGGKVEPGETELAALQREWYEELGISINHATPWLCKIHDYEHARVRVRFYRIQPRHWHGHIQAHEGQQWQWQQAHQLSVAPMLPANAPILKALRIPEYLSGQADTGYHTHQHGQRISLVPWSMATEAHQHIVFNADEMEAIRRFGAPITIYACVNQPHEWPTVADADAVLWRLNTDADAQHLLSILRPGVAQPILLLGSAHMLHRHAAACLDAGAHGVIEDTTLPTA